MTKSDIKTKDYPLFECMFHKITTKIAVISQKKRIIVLKLIYPQMIVGSVRKLLAKKIEKRYGRWLRLCWSKVMNWVRVYFSFWNINQDWEKAILQTIRLCGAEIKFKQADRILVIQNIQVHTKDHWNLIRSNRLLKDNQDQVILNLLEAKRFYVKCHENIT